MQQDLETNFRAVLRSSLGKLDLVTRDEFDTQSKVLERTRARLEALEDKVKELESLAGSAAGKAECVSSLPGLQPAGPVSAIWKPRIRRGKSCGCASLS